VVDAAADGDDADDDPVPAATAEASVMVMTSHTKTYSANKMEGLTLTCLQHKSVLVVHKVFRTAIFFHCDAEIISWKFVCLAGFIAILRRLLDVFSAAHKVSVQVQKRWTLKITFLFQLYFISYFGSYALSHLRISKKAVT
jgi:hypothetical protein